MGPPPASSHTSQGAASPLPPASTFASAASRSQPLFSSQSLGSTPPLLGSSGSTSSDGQLWADKYRPTTVEGMCYPAAANRLLQWIATFDRAVHSSSPAAEGADKFHRGALLSGPPGIGKTTAVHVVARQLGRQLIELNASDKRSKRSLVESVSDLVDNTVLGRGGHTMTAHSAAAATTLHRLPIILMDEIDGCDPGGVGEVIAMLKKTKVPIICTCNDRFTQKLRSLVNYCEDIRCSRPPYTAIASFVIQRVLRPEGFTVPPAVLEDIIQRDGNDMRSVINNLQLWCVGSKRNMSSEEVARCALSSFKNHDQGMFGVPEELLVKRSATGPPMRIEDQLAAFYNGELVDLFIHENYLHFRPITGADWLKSVARASRFIAEGDVVSRTKFVDQNWSVSSTHAFLSTVLPCSIVRGEYQSFLTGPAVGFDKARPVKFPTWLGNNSSGTKNRRLLVCAAHECALAGCGMETDSFAMDRAPLIAAKLSQLLTESGAEDRPNAVKRSIAFMDSYHLLRDDFDFVNEISRFSRIAASHHTAFNRRLDTVPAATKSAFTREFNKLHRFETVGQVSKAGAAAVSRGRAEPPPAAGSDDMGRAADAADAESGSDDEDESPAATAPKRGAPTPRPPGKGAPSKRQSKVASKPPAAPAAGKRLTGAKRKLSFVADVDDDED